MAVCRTREAFTVCVNQPNLTLEFDTTELSEKISNTRRSINLSKILQWRYKELKACVYLVPFGLFEFYHFSLYLVINIFALISRRRILSLNIFLYNLNNLKAFNANCETNNNLLTVMCNRFTFLAEQSRVQRGKGYPATFRRAAALYSRIQLRTEEPFSEPFNARYSRYSCDSIKS